VLHVLGPASLPSSPGTNGSGPTGSCWRRCAWWACSPRWSWCCCAATSTWCRLTAPRGSSWRATASPTWRTAGTSAARSIAGRSATCAIFAARAARSRGRRRTTGVRPTLSEEPPRAHACASVFTGAACLRIVCTFYNLFEADFWYWKQKHYVFFSTSTFLQCQLVVVVVFCPSTTLILMETADVHASQRMHP